MDFGFYLTPSSTIELDKVDRTAVDDLARADSGFRTCIACGSCEKVCPQQIKISGVMEDFVKQLEM